DHLRDAVWRVVSSVPAPRKGAKRSRYPAALGEVLARHDAQLSLKKLDRLRRKYGAGANLFAAALVARAEGRKREFRVLRDAMRASEPSLSRAAERALGMSASDFLTRLDDRRTARRVRKLRHEVGLSLYEFVGEFADAMAFDAWWPPTS